MRHEPSPTDGPTGAVAAALLVPATVVVLGLTWSSFALPGTVLVGASLAIPAGTVLTLSLAIAAVWMATLPGWHARLHVARYVLGIAVLAAVVAAFVAGVVVLPLALTLGPSIAVATAALVVLGICAAVAVAVLGAIADATTGTDWALNLRMLAAGLLLVAVTVGFLVGAWTIVWLVCALGFGVIGLLDLWFVSVLASLVVAIFAAGIVYEEIVHVRTVAASAHASVVEPSEHPELHATVTRIAQQLDVPKPTVAVADSDAPEAMVVGFHPDRMHLVVSTGTLDALSPEELSAVVAHELAHVANRDAMVMTAVSVPIVLAEGFRARAAGVGDDDEKLFAGVLVAFATASKAVGRLVVAVLSRARETSADRAAVAVTGSPAALATALRTLDDTVAETPENDLREAASISSLSIVPLDPADPEPTMLGPDGTREPYLWTYREPIEEFKARFYRTHPPTEDRIDALRDAGTELD